MNEFKQRVFGAAVIKSINSNYNADFSGQPRTLPDGIVYATDKALKYTIKNYLIDIYNKEKILYFKKFMEIKGGNFRPLALHEAYEKMFETEIKETAKKQIYKDLISCIDIRLFGATFAPKGKGEDKNVSIHGPVQINHGINAWHENEIYNEQITSPFINPSEQSEEEQQKGQTTIGRQSKLHEGHYLHHFSVNPKNLEEHQDESTEKLTQEDIDKLKEAMQRGATYYDSSSKSGTENELLVWVQLKEGSKVVLPNFSQLIKLKEEKEDGKVVADLKELNNVFEKYKNEIDGVEIYQNASSIQIEGKPQNANIKDI